MSVLEEIRRAVNHKDTKGTKAGRSYAELEYATAMRPAFVPFVSLWLTLMQFSLLHERVPTGTAEALSG